MTTKGENVFHFCGDENNPKINWGDSCTTLSIY